MAERDEARLLARIEAGERIESPDEMTEAYRENLIHLMTMQADSELAGGYGYVPWITEGARGGGEARGRPDREGRAPPRHRHVRPPRRPRRGRGGARAGARRGLHDAHRQRRRHRHRAHHRRQAGQHLLLPDRHLGRLHLLQLLHGPRRGPPARGRARLLLRAVGARDRGHLQGGEVPHPPRRVLGEAPRRGSQDPRRGPGHAQQVVHPHHEHLRAPGLAPRTCSTGSTASSCATTTRSARPSPARSRRRPARSASRCPSGSRSGTVCPKRRRSPGDRAEPASVVVAALLALAVAAPAAAQSSAPGEGAAGVQAAGPGQPPGRAGAGRHRRGRAPRRSPGPRPGRSRGGGHHHARHPLLRALHGGAGRRRRLDHGRAGRPVPADGLLLRLRDAARATSPRASRGSGWAPRSRCGR